MNIVFRISDIDEKNLCFLETKKNIIIDGNFTKLLYSNEFFTMNGIYLQFPIQLINIDKTINKNNISFNIHDPHNYDLIKIIAKMEESIIQYYKLTHSNNKRTVYSLYNQLLTGKLKLYKEVNEHSIKPSMSHNVKIVLKISGIWETFNEIGITYKFIEMYDLAF